MDKSDIINEYNENYFKNWKEPYKQQEIEFYNPKTKEWLYQDTILCFNKYFLKNDGKHMLVIDQLNHKYLNFIEIGGGHVYLNDKNELLYGTVNNYFFNYDRVKTMLLFHKTKKICDINIEARSNTFAILHSNNGFNKLCFKIKNLNIDPDNFNIVEVFNSAIKQYGFDLIFANTILEPNQEYTYEVIQ